MKLSKLIIQSVKACQVPFSLPVLHQFLNGLVQQAPIAESSTSTFQQMEQRSVEPLEGKRKLAGEGNRVVIVGNNT